MKILIFGAGSTGRGHLSALLYEHGYQDITYVDINTALVEKMRLSKSYKIKLLGSNERTLEISGYKILNRSQEDEIIEAFCQSDMVYTSVIAENLENVSHIIAKAIIKRKLIKNDTPLNVIACENLNNASTYLKNFVLELLTQEIHSYVDKYIGFPDCIISRVVPLTKENPLFLVAEDYNEWFVRKSDFKGADPHMPFMEVVPNLEALLERKLWIHNGGHATVAYAGLTKGYKYIAQAVSDSDISNLAGSVMLETGNAICYKHHFDEAEIKKYIEVFVQRGLIEEMKDDILRVVRDPIRKLGLHDRLVAPALYAIANKLPCQNILQSIINVTEYDNLADTESVTMQAIIKTHGLKYFLENTIGMAKNSEIVQRLLDIKECHSYETC